MKKREKAHLLLANACLWMMIGLYVPFLSAYLLLKGLTAQQIGLIVSLYPLMSLVAAPWWGRRSDQADSRKKILTIACIGVSLCVCFFYAASSFVHYFLCALAVSFFLTALTPLLDSLILLICRKKALNFSLFRIGGTVGYAVIVLIYGFVLNKCPQLQFVSIACLSLVLLLLVRKITEPKQEKSLMKQAKRPVFTSKNIYFVMVLSTLCMFGVNYIGNFLGVILVEDGISRSMIGVMNFTSAFSEIPVLLLVDRIVERVNVKKVLLFAAATVVLRLLFLATGKMSLILFSQCLQSTSYMLAYYTSIHFVMKTVVSGKEAQGQSLLFSVQNGAGAILSSLIGGWLIGHFNGKISTIVLASIILFVLISTKILTRSGKNVNQSK